MLGRLISRYVLAAFFLIAGLNHFRVPELYVDMMPPWLPWPRELVYGSGAAEILGAIGVLVPFTRRFAGWGLIVLLIAIFPANLHVALQGRMPGFEFPPSVLWGRLPLQLVLLVWVWWTAIAPQRNETLD